MSVSPKSSICLDGLLEKSAKFRGAVCFDVICPSEPFSKAATVFLYFFNVVAVLIYSLRLIW